MGNIAWVPIAEMPDALKDGREVLLWETVSRNALEVATWDCVWCDQDGATIHGVTHFAEINPPAMIDKMLEEGQVKPG